MNISDTLVHINQTLDAEKRNHIEDELRTLDGVIAPRFSFKRKHLLMVIFNPDKVNSIGLIRKITSMGLDAQLVSM